MDISKKLEPTEEFSFDFEGEKVTFTAYQASCTPAFLDDIRTARLYPKAVVRVVKSWDITGADGKPWSLKESEVARLPVDFLDTLLAVITHSWQGDSKKDESLPAGSAQAAS